MVVVTMTVFFTHCWRSARTSLVSALVGVCLLLVPLHPVRADGAPAEITQMRLERSGEGLFLFANVRVDLPAAVEEALVKGVPMYFLAEVDVVRHRWYWSDKVVASVQRHLRLAYQPLTRRWRLHVSSGLINSNSLGMALNQNFDSLSDAMTAVQRFSGWKVADASVIDTDATHKVEFRFGLDLAQLPRPFQIGAFGHSDWSISAKSTQQISPEAAR
jgi:hypothetical protein